MNNFELKFTPLAIGSVVASVPVDFCGPKQIQCREKISSRILENCLYNPSYRGKVSDCQVLKLLYGVKGAQCHKFNFFDKKKVICILGYEKYNIYNTS